MATWECTREGIEKKITGRVLAEAALKAIDSDMEKGLKPAQCGEDDKGGVLVMMVKTELTSDQAHVAKHLVEVPNF